MFADNVHIYVAGLPNTTIYKHGDLDIGYLMGFTYISSDGLCGNEIKDWTHPYMAAVR